MASLFLLIYRPALCFTLFLASQTCSQNQTKCFLYRKEISQQSEQQTKDSEKWKQLEQLLHGKLAEKKAEVDDNISYYSQREAEYETKIDELMTRLQVAGILWWLLSSISGTNRSLYEAAVGV